MICKNCNSKLSESVKFCPNCGTAITELVKKPAASISPEFKFRDIWIRSTLITFGILTVLSIVPSLLIYNNIADIFSYIIFSIPADLLFSVGISTIVTYFRKWKNEAVLNRNFKHTGKNGLGGWLILVIIGIVAAAIFQIYSIFDSITLLNNGTVDYLGLSVPGYSDAFKFELLVEFIILLFSSYLIYLFFKKKVTFPKYYIAFLVSIIVFNVVILFIISSLSFPEGVEEIGTKIISEQEIAVGKQIVYALIWGSYILYSKQVKATFIK